ncbi:MAG: hypothetical protein SFU86_20670, partial [Pirellulaceae bacterium]|nr:hypothetical protein [Pirellulaceae bacterium]
MRFRLTLWNAAAGLLTGLGILLALREGVRYTLLYDLDEVLREDLQEISLHFAEPGDYDWFGLKEKMNLKARGHDFHGWFVVFLDAEGRPAWSSVNAPPIAAPTAAEHAAGRWTSGDYRLALAALPRNVEEAATVAVGCNIRFVGRDMAKIDRLMAIVGIVIALVSPIGGYLLAGRTTRILAKMIHKTERLRPSEL